VPAYPDGHPTIDRSVLRDALHAKQALITDAGVAAGASTQMCFDADRIRGWLQVERSQGLTLPIHLGVPGVVDRARLMRMGARLGVGTSLRYLSKNRASIVRMLAPGGYDPTDLVRALAPDAELLGIVGLHSFTFNSVADTAKWRETLLAARS
jgi:methylenetetrahydrofolate reductase (NADPH)